MFSITITISIDTWAFLSWTYLNTLRAVINTPESIVKATISLLKLTIAIAKATVASESIDQILINTCFFTYTSATTDLW